MSDSQRKLQASRRTNLSFLDIIENENSEDLLMSSYLMAQHPDEIGSKVITKAKIEDNFKKNRQEEL